MEKNENEGEVDGEEERGEVEYIEYVKLRKADFEKLLKLEDKYIEKCQIIKGMKRKKRLEMERIRETRAKLEVAQHKSKRDWVKLVETLKTIYSGQLQTSDREISRLKSENRELIRTLDEERESYEKALETQRRRIEDQEDRVFETRPVLKVVEKQVRLKEKIKTMKNDMEAKDLTIKNRDRMIDNLNEHIKKLENRIEKFEWDKM